MNKPKIFYLYTSPSSFEMGDLRILKDHYDVQECAVNYFGTDSNYKRYVHVFKEIVKGVIWADIVFAWFADKHSYIAVLLAKLLGKKSIVVIGGYEVAKIPELNYGALLDVYRSRRVRRIIEFADCILAVSELNMREILNFARPRHIDLIYNGVDSDYFTPNGEKENIIVTVSILNEQNIKRKGIETFIKAAELVPNGKFVVIGKSMGEKFDLIKRDAPNNVEFTGHLSKDELLRWYQKAKIYCQLSYYESFGVSLAEAMSCQCIPIITKRGALPEVAGTIGYTVPYGDAEATAEAINKALYSKDSPPSRERILQNFSTNRREVELIALIENFH